MKYWSEQFDKFPICSSFNNFSSSFLLSVEGELVHFSLFDGWHDNFDEILSWQYDFLI